jgi:hypothetical protein
MKIKIKQVFLCFFVFSTVLLAASWAQGLEEQNLNSAQNDQADSWWRERADINKDGNVDEDELVSWGAQKELIDSNGDGKIDDNEKRLAWKYVRSPVATEIGQDFDNNNNGWLEPEEARKVLFRTIDYVFRTNGRGPMRTEVEKAYDSNEDGVIDLEEAKTLREDLR